jgi:hypothetical protein
MIANSAFTMLDLADPRTAIVKLFMTLLKYDDTNHPAVQLVDIFIADHPEILTYTKYAALWMVLNILTLFFTIYASAKIIIFMVPRIWRALVAVTKAFNCLLRVVGGSMVSVPDLDPKKRKEGEEDEKVVAIRSMKQDKRKLETRADSAVGSPEFKWVECIDGQTSDADVVYSRLRQRRSKRAIPEWDISTDKEEVVESSDEGDL